MTALRILRSIAAMQTVSDLLETIGRDRFMAETGFKPQVISRAVVENIMPSGWYLAVRTICEREGVAVPDELFRWSDKRKSPVHAPEREAS